MARKPVSEQISEALNTVKQDTARAVSSGDFGGEAVFLENLGNHASNFTDRIHGPIKMEAHGYIGSVVQIPPALAKNAFLRRAIQRKKVRLLSLEQADQRVESLHELPGGENGEVSNDIARIMKALGPDASSQDHRYAKEGLQEYGFERRQITPEEIHGVNQKSNTVRRSTSTNRVPNSNVDVQVTEVLPPEQVLTNRVREGEMQSDDGLN